MAVEIHVGDTGTVFKFTITDQDGNIVNVAPYTVTAIFQPPTFHSTKIIVPTTLFTDGTDGIVQYVSVSGDLNQPGWWRAQTEVQSGPQDWHSNIIRFQVFDNL